MFPLLNLPRIPRDEIVKQIGLTERFHFSMLSKRCATAAERAKVKVDLIQWNTQYFDYRIYVQRLISDNGLKEHFTISMSGGPSPYRGTSSDHEFTVKSSNYSKPTVYASKPTEFLLEHLSAHILKIFKADKLHWVEQTFRPWIPIFWRRLNLRFEKISCFDWEAGKDCRISHESLEFLLDNINTDSLDFDYRLHPGFQYSKPLKIKMFWIMNADWFTLDNLLNNECETLKVGGSKFTTSDLNEFFEMWNVGCFPKLTFLMLYDPKDVQWELSIPIEETDDKGRQILTDVNGNRGTFVVNQSRLIKFKVNLQDD